MSDGSERRDRVTGHRVGPVGRALRLLRAALEAVERVTKTEVLRFLLLGLRLKKALPITGGTSSLLLSAIAYGLRRSSRPATIRVNTARGTSTFVIPDRAALLVMSEVFLQLEYDIALPSEPERVVDLGASFGAAALFFMLKWPNAILTCVEPNPELLPILRSNVAPLGAEIKPGAIGVTRGTVAFSQSSESWSGFTGEVGEVPWADSIRRHEVDCWSFDEVARGADLVKIDVEGAEREILLHSQALDSIGAIVGEIHEPPLSEASIIVLGRLRVDFEVWTPEVDESQRFTVFRAKRKLQ